MTRALPAFGLLVTGCTATTFPSEDGQLTFQHRGVTSDEFVDVGPGPILEGTVLCATVCRSASTDALGCTDNGIIETAACFDPAAEGSGSLDADGCFVADAPGEAAWRFDPVACTTADGFVPVEDRVTFAVVAPDDVVVSLDFPYDRIVSETIAAGPGLANGATAWTTEADGNVPANTLPEPGEPMRVIADEPVPIYVKMRDRTGAPVVRAYGDVSIVATRGEPPVVTTDDGQVILSAPVGSAGDITLTVGDRAFPAGAYEAVGAEEATSLELVAVISSDTDDQGAFPVGARAIVRDADGRPLFGAPVTWDVARGRMVVVAGPDAFIDASYADLMEGRCYPDDGRHRATLRATLGALSDSVKLEWRDVKPEGEDRDWAVSDDCIGPGACGCNSGTGPIGGVGWVAGALLVIRTQRRAITGSDRRRDR